VTAPPSDRPLPPADSFKFPENDFVQGLLARHKFSDDLVNAAVD
jgi:hypothetical protein